MKTLDLAEFRSLVEEFKDDLQREANQWVLKRDVHAAASSLAAIDAVERLSHRVMARLYNVGEQPEVIQTKKVKPFKRRKPGLPEPAPVVRKREKVREIPSAVGE
jgi:hypothetical protein